ncbi:MAG TPA: acetate/propionate family kinase, partial [Steroidobacteraceae bacterium]|nr:acetate/propionate family kinase [Steroidobacteraceae bacterium]
GGTEAVIYELQVTQIGAVARFTGKDIDRELGEVSYAAAIEALLSEVKNRTANHPINGVVHRVVHGSSQFTAPTLISDEVLQGIESVSSLAPLHNPPALIVIRAARVCFPDTPHVAVFDTAFHNSLPARAREYALPRKLAEQFQLRRFGFHGINYAHINSAAAKFLRSTPQELRIIACHLGNGASVCAIERGKSVETSMGMTPTEGLVMGTRSGDVDPGVILRLLQEGYDAKQLDTLLNRESGLIGLAGTFDFRAIEERAAAGDEGCRMAITLYAHRIRKYIGAYAAVMGGVDAVVFTAGIGENSSVIRHRVCQRLEFLGAVLDEDRNRDARLNDATPIVDVSADVTRTRILVVRADEQNQMVRDATALLSKESRDQSLRIPVAVSARHVHLSVATIHTLFGPGYELKTKTELSQHGQFAAQETVALIGPRGRLDNVRVMGPPRKEDQVEISRTDEFVLGVDAPVRLSGDLANTPGITLAGPSGKVTITHGVICARRHIHMNPADAQRFGVQDRDSVNVRIDSEGRDLTFSDVIVRVAPNYELEMHLDTDEGNAAEVVRHQEGEVYVPIKASASIA